MQFHASGQTRDRSVTGSLTFSVLAAVTSTDGSEGDFFFCDVVSVGSKKRFEFVAVGRNLSAAPTPGGDAVSQASSPAVFLLFFNFLAFSHNCRKYFLLINTDSSRFHLLWWIFSFMFLGLLVFNMSDCFSVTCYTADEYQQWLIILHYTSFTSTLNIWSVSSRNTDERWRAHVLTQLEPKPSNSGFYCAPRLKGHSSCFAPSENPQGTKSKLQEHYISHNTLHLCIF